MLTIKKIRARACVWTYVQHECLLERAGGAGQLSTTRPEYLAGDAERGGAGFAGAAAGPEAPTAILRCATQCGGFGVVMGSR